MPFLEPVGTPRPPLVPFLEPLGSLGPVWFPSWSPLGCLGLPRCLHLGAEPRPKGFSIGFPEDFCASVESNHARKSGKNPGTNPGPVFFESKFGPRIRMNSGGNSGGNSERNPGGNPGRNSGINSGGSSESNSGGNSGSNAERNSGGNSVGQFDEQFGFAAKQQKALIRIPETLDRSFPKIGTLGLQKVKG